LRARRELAGAQRRETAGALEDLVEARAVGHLRVAIAQPAERLRVVLLRLLRERAALDRAAELLLARRDRARVGQRPGEEDGTDLVAQEGQERRLERVPRLEVAGGARVEHALDPGNSAGCARAHDRPRRRIRGGLV